MSQSETAFEKRRGISSVELRTGYAQVHVTGMQEPCMEHRLQALEDVSKAGISIDFLKLTPGGFSFVVREQDANALEAALHGRTVALQQGQHVVMVHAVNMRDEEGLIASIVFQAIRSGAKLGHISDMHDRVLMVVDQNDSQRLKEQLEGSLAEAQR